jgi:DNA-binding NtrC family response regulator
VLFYILYPLYSLQLGPESEKDRKERLKLERVERIKNIEKHDENEIDASSATIEEASEQIGKAHDKPRHLKVVKTKLIEEFERAYLTEAMNRNRGNIANAARYSGKHRRAFWALLRKYDIEAEDFRS